MDDFQDSFTQLFFYYFNDEVVKDVTAEDESSTADDSITNQQVLQQPHRKLLWRIKLFLRSSQGAPLMSS
jgi:hypothetical protein